MEFTDVGEAIHELRPILHEEMTPFALSQIYGLFRSKTLDLVKTLVEEEKQGKNFDDIDVYAFFHDQNII